MKLKEFIGSYNEARAANAAEQVRKNALPGNADAYKVELPKDFQVPQGVEYAFKPDDPLLSQARSLAHETGLSQHQFSRFLALYAGAQVADQQLIQKARDAELAKLGPTASARIDAIKNYYEARLGSDDAAIRMQRILTAADVRIAEKEIVAANPTHGGFTHQGRDPGEPQKVDPKTYDSWTYTEKKDYASRFPQGNGRAA